MSTVDPRSVLSAASLHRTVPAAQGAHPSGSDAALNPALNPVLVGRAAALQRGKPAPSADDQASEHLSLPELADVALASTPLSIDRLAQGEIVQLAQLNTGLAGEFQETHSDAPASPVVFDRTDAPASAAQGSGNTGLYALLGGGLALALGGAGGGGGASGSSSTQATVVAHDGLIKGASVYIDSNNDGSYSASEKVGVTNDRGELVLTNPSDLTHTLIVVGGTNVDTGLPNTLELKLTGGLVSNASVVVSPLTTLMTAVYDLGDSSMTVADAASAVKAALGLPSAVDLSTFNPWATGADAAQALAVQKAAAELTQVLNTVSAGDASTAQDALDALAQYLIDHDGAINLSDASVLETVLGEVAAAVVVDWGQLADEVSSIQAATQLSGVSAAQQAAAAPDIVGLLHDTGSSATDGITSDARLKISGRNSAATLELSTDGGLSWVAEANFAPQDGTHSVLARLHYSNGNYSEISSAFEFTLKAAVPTAPTLALHADTGASETDGLTHDAQLLVGGRVSGAVLEYSLDQTTWSTTLPTLADGAHDVYARQSFELAGTTSPVVKLSFTLDTTAQAGTAGLAANTDETVYDTGADATDGITNATDLVLHGQAEAGVTAVSVTIAGTTYEVDAADIQADGSWNLTLPEALDEGVYTPVVTVTDAAGNVSAPTSMSPITIDTTAPEVTEATARLSASSDSGVADDDGITNVTRPTLEGDAEAHAIVHVDVDGTEYQTQADAQGHWSVVVTTALDDNEYTPSITVEDLAGNISDAFDGTAFTVDASAPEESTPVGLVQDEEFDTGSSSEDGITSNTLPLLTGAVDAAGVVVSIKLGGGTYVTQTDDAGEWTLQIPDDHALEDGSYVPGVTYSDDAGNELHVSGQPIVIDTTAPDEATAELVHDAANDTGSASDDSVTANSSPTIAGTAEAGAHIAVDVGGTVFETDAGVDGHWSVTADGLVDNEYTPAITVTDAAGNVSDAIDGETFTVDTTLGEFSGGLTHDADNDTGADSEDGITHNNKPELSGTAEAGATVVVEIGDQRYQVEADADGAWSVAVEKSLDDGEYTPTITVTDAAGNTDSVDADTITIDTVAGSEDDGAATNQALLLGDVADIEPLEGYVLADGDTLEDTLGSLPEGLSIDTDTLHIVGTAEAVGLTYLTLTSTDVAGNVATHNFQVAVTVAEKSSDLDSFTINNTDEAQPKTYIGEGTDQHLNIYASAGDVVLAGDGDDLFQLFKPESLGFARLDGGDGTDRVNFSGNDLSLDLADWNNPEGTGQAVEQVEVLYFGGKNSSLTVSAADLFHLQSDVFDVDDEHQMVRFMSNSTNGGKVTLTDLTQVGAVDAFGADGDATTGAANDKYTKFVGSYADSAGEHLVELLLQHGLTAS